MIHYISNIIFRVHNAEPPTTTVNTILTFYTAERSDASVVGGRTPPTTTHYTPRSEATPASLGDAPPLTTTSPPRAETGAKPSPPPVVPA